MIDYRKFYESEIGKSLPDGYEIHHIDFNRENNLIRNLVAMPIKLHQEYHILANNNYQIDVILPIRIGFSSYNDFILDKINLFIPVYNECCKWVDYRDFLIGLIPNIHNLKY